MATKEEESVTPAGYLGAGETDSGPLAGMEIAGTASSGTVRCP